MKLVMKLSAEKRLLWFQEPFVNIPEETIREALKVLIGIRNSSLSFYFYQDDDENLICFHGSNICCCSSFCRCKESSCSYSLQKRKGLLLHLHVDLGPLAKPGCLIMTSFGVFSPMYSTAQVVWWAAL